MPEETLLTKEFDDERIKSANDSIIKYLQDAMDDSEGEFVKLRRKLTVTYWTIVILSFVMFVLGLVLISVPIIAAFNQDIEKLTSLISAGFGIADLAALFLYGPIERMHKIMGDMSQLILILNSYRSQVGLYLMEMDIKARSTIGDSAREIDKVTQNCVKLIQNYFEPLLSDRNEVKEPAEKTL